MSWKMNRIAAKDDWEEGKESVACVTFKEKICYSNHYYGVQDKIKADEVSVPPRANYNIPFLEIWSVCKLIAIAGPRQGSKTQLVIMVLDCVVFARSFRLLSCWCLFKVPIRERASTEMIFDLNIHLCTKSSVKTARNSSKPLVAGSNPASSIWRPCNSVVRVRVLWRFILVSHMVLITF